MPTRGRFALHTMPGGRWVRLRTVTGRILVGVVWGCATLARAQQTAAAPASNAELELKFASISAALEETQRQIDQSQRQMRELQTELRDLRHQMTASGADPATLPDAGAQSGPEPAAASIEERQQTTEAAVKVLDQVKVESASKYPVKLTGLVLFNGFLNRGVPDNVDLPAVALASTSTSGDGSLGGSLRQTILGVEAEGPHFLNSHTSANVYIDFFNGLAYTSYGTSAGVVRLRTAAVDLDWQNDSIEVGMASPLISPLNPTSYATVAEPSLAGAGNLWTWAPQLRYAHRFELSEADRLQLEFGLWDPAAAGYNTSQLFRTASPGELSQQPAYQSRISYVAHGSKSAEIAAGGYYNRETYPGYAGTIYTDNLDAWAATADWRVPLSHIFEFSGEGYRGRAIGGLGGGVYKDVVTGTSPYSGVAVLHGLNAGGGWTQLKTRFTSELETNAAMGLDDGFARDFHAMVLPATATAAQLRARNRMLVGNVIYRPKTYIILSPEFRRIWTWPINNQGNTLNVYTLSVGYEF
jgi:uncharacterized coiled-coil protein SlyX